MVHRYYSIALALASILASGKSVEVTEVRIPSALRVSKDATTTAGEAVVPKTDTYIGDDDNDLEHWMKWEMTEERYVKCKASANKAKMQAGRECEGGAKQVMSASVGSLDLAKGVLDEIQDMHSNMVPDQTSLLIPEETMTELMSWDDDSSGFDVFYGEDCFEEDKPCKKKLEFGGYFKLFWGCNITLSMAGLKLSKDVACDSKSYEGMGKKEDMGYFGTDEYDDHGDWVKADMTLGKGAKCKTNAKIGKECEGGVKKGVSVHLGSEDLAQAVSAEIQDMHSNVVLDQKSLHIPEETMQELINWDDATGADFFDGADCAKKVVFGGSAKLFWGCNITFSKKGKKMSKEVGCGFKSSQVIGKKDGKECY
jgi:hypothetical protein